MSEMIRLRGVHGQDEVNARGVSYKVRWGVVRMPAEDIAPLLHVGGFHVAHEADESAEHSTLEDVEAAVWSLPPGKVRSTLLMLVTNTNAMNYVIQSDGRTSVSSNTRTGRAHVPLARRS